MKKIILPSAFAIFTSISSAQLNHVTLKASLPGLPAGKWVYISGMNTKKIDSVKSISDGFKIEKDIPVGEGNAYNIILESRGNNEVNSSTTVFLDSGDVFIHSKGSNFKNAVFSGNAAMDDMNNYNTTIDAESQHLHELYAEQAEARSKKDSAKLFSLREQIKQSEEKRGNIIKQWLNNHTASPVSAYVLMNLRFFYMDMDEISSYYDKLQPMAKNNLAAKELGESVSANRMTGIGKTAPDFTQPDTLGKPVSLKDFRGKYVLLDFWASWCHPCREENPNVVKAFNKFKDQNFTILSVSFDQKGAKDKWLDAIHHDGLTWTNISELKFWDNNAAKLYDIQGIPANFLIDPNGIIIARDLRGKELDQKLSEVLYKK